MNEEHVKKILLSLVEPNRKFGRDVVPSSVKGWRFEDVDEEQHRQPVCSWTGVTCDPVGGEITGLNIGNGLYVKSLLGLDADEDGEDKSESEESPIVGEKGARDLEDAVSFTKQRQRANAVARREAVTVGPSFPTQLGKLETLRFLSLSNNRIQGTIPLSVLKLPNLAIFDVSSNDLVGEFPHLKSESLRILDLSKNRLSGRLDEELFGHPDVGRYTAPYLFTLVKFDISHNAFEGTIPLSGTSGFYKPDGSRHLSEESLQQLQYFDVGYNLFSGTIPNNIGNFQKLSGLFLEHNNFVGTIPKSIYRGSGRGANPLPLVQLFLQQNQLSGTIHEGLATLPNLKEIYVDGNKFTGKVPSSLCDLELNGQFLEDKSAASRCDGISCPVNSASREGVAPCRRCPNDNGVHRYLGQHDNECRDDGLNQEEILDLFYNETHGDEWNDATYAWEIGEPACERKGVQCNGNGAVTNITLPSLGLRGPIIPELSYLTRLRTLDLRHNELTGFLPSDLRFINLENLDIRGTRLSGVVPPLLCIKEQVNGNGVGPQDVDFNRIYSCDNFACPRGTYSSIGRAIIPQGADDPGVECAPCFDSDAALYLGSDKCTDVTIAGMQLRKEDIMQDAVKSISALVLVAGVVGYALAKVKGRRRAVLDGNCRDGKDEHEGIILSTPARRLSDDSSFDDEDSDDSYERSGNSFGSPRLLQRWISPTTRSPLDDGDDWTASDSVGDRGRRQAQELREFSRSRSVLPDVI